MLFSLGRAARRDGVSPGSSVALEYAPKRQVLVVISVLLKSLNGLLTNLNLKFFFLRLVVARRTDG